jgi:hypothetical protein
MKSWLSGPPGPGLVSCSSWARDVTKSLERLCAQLDCCWRTARPSEARDPPGWALPLAAVLAERKMSSRHPPDVATAPVRYKSASPGPRLWWLGKWPPGPGHVCDLLCSPLASRWTVCHLKERTVFGAERPSHCSFCFLSSPPFSFALATFLLCWDRAYHLSHCTP